MGAIFLADQHWPSSHAVEVACLAPPMSAKPKSSNEREAQVFEEIRRRGAPRAMMR